MSQFDTEQPTTVDGPVAIDPTWSPLRVEKLITFIGGTSGAWGDKDGALASAAIFTVTGTVRLRIIGVVETDLAGNGKLEVGYEGSTAKLLAQVQDTETMDEYEIYHDADLDSAVEASTVMSEYIITKDVWLTTSVADITAGAIRFLVSWYPISANGKVIPSSN